MKVFDVVERAIKDEGFARSLADKALRASDAPAGLDLSRPEWQALLREFAESPEELAQLTDTSSEGERLFTTCIGTITGTVVTVTTLVCTTTTTTPVTTATFSVQEAEPQQ